MSGLDQLRAAIAAVDPADLTVGDRAMLLDLFERSLLSRAQETDCA